MTQWRILVVDDDPVVAPQTAELLRTAPVSSTGEIAEVEHTTSFDEALKLLARRRYDLAILDIRDQAAVEPFEDRPDDDATDADVGLYVFDQVRSERFIPVIFYSAVPNLAADLIRPPFVDVVSKQAEIDELRQKIRAVIDSSLPRIHQKLLGHVEAVMRDFMVEFVEKQWNILSSPPRKGDMAHLLLRKLARSLADGGETLALDVDDIPGIDLHDEHVHPMRYYVMPPSEPLTTGDILKSLQADTGAVENWYVVLTPACDLVPGRIKTDYVVVAQAVPLENTVEFKAWQEGHYSAESANSIKKAMRNRPRSTPGRNEDRTFYLPGAWTVPDLLIDLQQLSHLPHKDIESYARVATLDSPYAEALVHKLSRYLGRIGTPDLDVDVAMTRLKAKVTADDAPANSPEV